MHINRKLLHKDLGSRLEYLCEYVDKGNSSNPCMEILGVSLEEATDILKKVVNALPVQLIINNNKAQKNNLKNQLVMEFFLFQCKEDTSDPIYPELLDNFIIALT